MSKLISNTVHVLSRTALSASVALSILSMTALATLAPSAQAQDTNLDQDANPDMNGVELDGLNDPAVLPSADESAEDPDDLRPLSQGTSFLSLQGGERLMNEASDAVAVQDYALAVQKLQEARQVYNQLSNFYQQLAGSFAGIDNRIADSQRQLALETAQMRDQATFQLALVHRAQNQPDLAVPLLVQIIQSQQPTRDLGQRAYRQLFELGFVDSPYPRNQADDEATSSAR